ncbi:unnamed protein product [Prorocentrum cordatum]|uniref:Uncharacterized protein n=1 Tax=Prorocentrum cordatum TaxID=2364126 RepID=A0ABN9SEQ1_9DINO|nr:unnamed protein product [Polarella glacialis]
MGMDGLLETMTALPIAQAAFGAALAALAGHGGQCGTKVTAAVVAAAARGAVQGMAAGASAACAHGGDDGYGKKCELVQLEVVLDAVKDAMNFTDPVSVQDAKNILRERGAPKLASRVGRLSKLRNAQGHPDVGLARDVRSHLAGSDAGSTGDGLTEQESLAGSDADPLRMVAVKDRVQPNEMQVHTFGAELEAKGAEKEKEQKAVKTGGTSGKKDAVAECARKHAVLNQATLSVESAKAALARVVVERDDAVDEMTDADAYLALDETEQHEVMVNLGLPDSFRTFPAKTAEF